MNFWEKLPKPFFVLAPMEDVTDAAFRRLIAKYASPDIPRVLYTEFTSADGLVRAPEDGKKKLLKKLEYSEAERPIVAQLFSSKPEYIEAGARLCAELGFDGFDINMGCPVDEVVRQECGASLIKNPPLARELIRAAKRGAPDIPISIKTRLGYNTDELETWLPELLAEEPAAVILHARTRKEMSDVPARWERIKRAVEIRDALGSKTLIVGNGDVAHMEDARPVRGPACAGRPLRGLTSNGARAKASAAKCDGVMLGRAIFGNPWLFSGRSDEPTQDEKIRALIEHVRLFQENLSGFVSEAIMKRHFKAYIGGWDGAKELRAKLMETENLTEAQELLRASL